jgi:hypothetical protein
MKGTKLFFLGVVLATLVFSTFWAGNVYASTGCFTDTNGNWAETFICWLKDNSISNGYGDGTFGPNNNVTRAEMAVFLRRVADVPPSTGAIYVNAGLNGWMPNGTSSNYVTYYTSYVQLRAPGAGAYGFQITPDLPATLYGRQMYTHSVKLCYDATYGASITGVYFEHLLMNGTVWEIYRIVQDTTVRTDATCREYTLPLDTSLWGSDHVALYLTANFTSAADHIRIGATTFTLVPSAIVGTLSLEDAGENREEVQEPQSMEEVPGTEPQIKE